MRIRTFKPEMLSHPVLSKLPDEVRLGALAVLSMSDDEGFFWASAAAFRACVWPFDESSTKARRVLDTLSDIGYIAIREHPTHGPIALVVNFQKHQFVDRKTRSKIRVYYDECDSTSPRRALDEPSTTDQGTGNREQVSERDRIGEGGSALKDAPNSEPPPPEPPKTPKAELALAPTIKTTVTPPGGRPSLEEVKTQCQLIGMDPKEGEKWWKDRQAEDWTDRDGNRIANWKRWLTCARDRVHALPARSTPCNGNGNGNGKSNSKANPAMMGNRRQLSDAEMRAADRLNVKFGYPPIYNLPPRT